MREVAELLNAMRAADVIADYALFGAVAQMRYTEPIATLDVDVLVAVSPPESLDVLTPIYAFCAAWPVQFIAVFSPLTREALEEAETVDFEGVPLRVVRADHLAVIALGVGRAKNFARILALLEAASVTLESIGVLAERHGLADAWNSSRGRPRGRGLADPCPGRRRSGW